MKAELDKSKASFKLDLIETANVDPMLTPADFKLLLAYVSVIQWPSCKAWLSEPLGMAMTGLNRAQFWKSRARLRGGNDEGRAYLLEARFRKQKVAEFNLVNPWRDEAIALRTAMMEYHREVVRQQKSTKRAASSLQNLETQNRVGPSRIYKSVPPDNSSNTPLVNPPRKKGNRVENKPSANVVPFKRNPRKAS